MTDETTPKSGSSSAKGPSPVRKPRPAGAGAPNQKKPSTPPEKTPPKGDFLGQIKKIPLPYLGGAGVALVMILFVIKAAMTPLPGESRGGEGAQQTAAPVEQPVQQQPSPQQTAPQPQASDQIAAQPSAPQGESAVPTYVGPKEKFDLGPVSTALPLISRIGDDLKELGREVKMTKKEFEVLSHEYDTFDLDGDPFLAYRVRVPETWQFMGPRELKDMQLNNRLMGVMAYYVSPADLELRSSLRIKAQRMTHMMSARDWVYHYALANRYTIQALSTYGDDRVEAVYVVTEMDVSYVVRVGVVVSGPRVVIAEYFVPIQKWEEEKDLQTWGITSFYLKKKDLSPPEPSDVMYFFDIASVAHPRSWNVQNPNIVSVDQMNASVVNMQEQKKDEPALLRGRVDVFLFAKNEDYTELMAMNTINAMFEDQELRVGKKIGRFVETMNKNGLRGRNFTVYAIENPQRAFQDYQYWITVLEGKNYFFYICLLTPPRDADIYNWSRNLGAFEYMVKTMKEGT